MRADESVSSALMFLNKRFFDRMDMNGVSRARVSIEGIEAQINGSQL